MPLIIPKVFISIIVEYAYEFFTNTILGRILKPVLDKWFYFQRDYSQDILLQQGLVKSLIFRHSKINFYIMMLNLEEMFYMNTCSERVYTHITGFLKNKEELDISKLKEH